MAYERPGTGPIDYLQCRYGHSKLMCRGPKREAKGKYYAFLGGTETFGKYVATPYVDLVQEAIGVPCVNFGAVNAGVDAFVNDLVVQDICNHAKRTYVQVLGAHNMSNRFYSVHPRRNDRFLKASTLMTTVFREVDFTEFSFTRHLLSSIEAASPEKFPTVVQELQEAWVARMTKLLTSITSPKSLLWMSPHAPPEEWVGPGLGNSPLFVTASMLDRLSENVGEMLEIVLPEDLAPGSLDDMLYPPMDVDAARETIGPAAHQFIAEKVLDTF